MKIFAHRGCSGMYPENTMASFEAACKTGCYGIELDVQLSKDGEVVVIHDERIDRTTNGKGFVRDYTLSQLQSLNASKIHAKAAPHEHIPSFEEYCIWVAKKNIVTNIEIKTGVYYYEGVEEKTLALVKKYGIEDRIVLSSFNPLSLVRVQELLPQFFLQGEIPCGLLSEHEIDNAGGLCRQNHYKSFHPGLSQLNKRHIYERVQNCHKNNISVNVWTVNRKADFRRLLNAGCDGVFTNYPEKFMS